MKRIIPMALIALTLTGGVALADRGRWRDTSNRSGGTIVTPTYGGHDHTRRDYGRYDNRRYNSRHNNVVVQRARPSFRNNRFYFTGGHYQNYQRPVTQYRYRNYYQRPSVVAENMQPVAGYVWSAGQWEWDGYEWHWIAGHYDVDTSYQESYYDNDDNDDQDSYYDNDQGSYYDNDQAPVYQAPAYQAPVYQAPVYQAPTISGGVRVQGSWNF